MLRHLIASVADRFVETQSKTALGPVALSVKHGSVLFRMDPSGKFFHFYEMDVVLFGSESKAQIKEFHDGESGFVLQSRWGRINESGIIGQVQSRNDYYMWRAPAVGALTEKKRDLERKGYTETYSQQYPVEQLKTAASRVQLGPWKWDQVNEYGDTVYYLKDEMLALHKGERPMSVTVRIRTDMFNKKKWTLEVQSRRGGPWVTWGWFSRSPEDVAQNLAAVQ